MKNAGLGLGVRNGLNVKRKQEETSNWSISSARGRQIENQGSYLHVCSMQHWLIISISAYAYNFCKQGSISVIAPTFRFSRVILKKSCEKLTINMTNKADLIKRSQQCDSIVTCDNYIVIWCLIKTVADKTRVTSHIFQVDVAHS